MMETNSPSLMSAVTRRNTKVLVGPCWQNLPMLRRAIIQPSVPDRRIHFQALFYDTPIKQVNGPIGVAGIARIVGDHADGSAVSMQLAQQIHDCFSVSGIQIPGGLI